MTKDAIIDDLKKQLSNAEDRLYEEEAAHIQTIEEKDNEIEQLESEVYKQFKVRTNCGEAKYYCDNPIDEQLFDLFTEALVSIKPTDMYDNLQKILKYKIVL